MEKRLTSSKGEVEEIDKVNQVKRPIIRKEIWAQECDKVNGGKPERTGSEKSVKEGNNRMIEQITRKPMQLGGKNSGEDE